MQSLVTRSICQELSANLLRTDSKTAAQRYNSTLPCSLEARRKDPESTRHRSELP